MENEITIKVKGSGSYYTLYRGATAVDMKNRKTRTIIKDVYDTAFFGLRKVLRESKLITEGSREYPIYNQLLEGML